jgi:thiosulfate/3-mercaptopyruvate sulfurtransferase
MKMSSRRTFARSAAIAILAAASVMPMPAPAQRAAPWTAAQVTQPSDLAATLSNGAKPVMLQVGFQVLYKSKHIPGSIYAGPGSTPQGLEALKQAVRNLPKDTGIYLYCGCCPIVRCPNIRPAYATLKSMGFTHLHVVMLETSFGQDWVAHGYPTTGDSAPGH